MNDFERQLEEMRDHIGTEWSALDQAEVKGRMERTLVRRRNLRRATAGSLGLVLVAAVVAIGLLRARPPDASLAQAPAAPRSKGLAPPMVAPPLPPRDGVLLADGSRLFPAAGARWEVVETTSTLVVVRLIKGKIEFDVPHREERRFLVEAGQVRVLDLGTVFTVDRTPEQVRVSVHSGRVLVEAATLPTPRTLGAGDLFEVEGEVPRSPPSTLRGGSPERSWRALARQGKYNAAFELLGPGVQRTGDDAGSLLLAADVARWSGHPTEATQYLERFLNRHASDRRASVAAFTLGRVLLIELSRPGEAAQAFGRARALDPDGPLAEDAWVRETESWARAGDREKARASARGFAEAFPHSRRLSEVKDLGETP